MYLNFMECQLKEFFVDSWYVPIEEHVSKKFLENYFKKKLKFFKYKKAL